MRVCAKIFRHADADLLCCSEVGDFRQGFSREDIAEVLPQLCQAFGKRLSHSWIDNRAALWACGAADERTGGASQPARVTLVDCQNYKLSVEREVDAAITAFDVVTPTGERYLVVVGNMHIVCTTNMFRTPHSRKMAVKRLGERLLTHVSAPEIPVVRVIVGNNNLTSHQVMLKLMGTARNAGLVLFSAIFLGDEITATQAFGYAICLFFFGLYNYYKMNKM